MQPLTVKQLMNNDNLYRSFFTYTLSLTSIIAGATGTDTVNIENDSQFVWTKTTYFVDEAGADQTDSSRVIPLINVQITDSGSARQFFNTPQPISSIAGQGNIPFILPAPFIFRNNSNINATFTNYNAVTTYDNVFLSLHGFRVYEYGNSLNQQYGNQAG